VSVGIVKDLAGGVGPRSYNEVAFGCPASSCDMDFLRVDGGQLSIEGGGDEGWAGAVLGSHLEVGQGYDRARVGGSACSNHCESFLGGFWGCGGSCGRLPVFQEGLFGL
jgi:hypothetical protein